MQINLEHFEENFAMNDLPHWACPKCERGILYLNNEQNLKTETSHSIKKRKGKNWQAKDVKSFFHGFLQCSKPDCKEIVSLTAGIGFKKKNKEYIEHIQPFLFLPPLKIFPIPENCSWETEQTILGAFALYWLDSASCANKIRSAIEHILTEQKIKSYLIQKGKKRSKLTLHARIKLLEKKKPEIALNLMAVKWIGNFGSHTEELGRDDILLGFQLLSDVLIELYSGDKEMVKAFRDDILKRKKPYFVS